MSRYLLDTNIVSELRKPKPHGAVLAWFHALSDSEIFVCAVTIGELQAGVERTRRHDAVKAGQIEAWVDQIADTFQILPMDTKSFREWGRLLIRSPLANQSWRKASMGSTRAARWAGNAEANAVIASTPSATAK
jgi:predicted nucleic acid-binding protein